MAPTLHSQFSASASQRLLSCPGSFKLGQDHDTGRKSSIYAAEGTLAHAISEACLFSGKDTADFVGQTRTADGFEFTVDEEFAEAAQTYVDFVEGLRAMGYIVALEQRVSPQVHWDGLPPLNIDLFGTCDCIAYHPGQRHLVIGDLKFGKGIAVEAEGNTQTLYYGSGALHEALLRHLVEQAGLTYQPPNKVSCVIIQPRAHHPAGPIRSADYTPDEVRDWARTALYAGVKRAMEDQGQTLLAGKWCRFCPALAQCTKPRDLAFETARDAFLGAPIENLPAPDDPNAGLPENELSDEKLGELLDRIAVVKPWIDAVFQLGLERSEKGRSVKGWKMVPKRALRRWADTDENIMAALAAVGINTGEVSRTTLLTPAQAEKKVGKKVYETKIAPHVVKQSSGNTLAPEGDPRARLRAGRTAQEAFGLPAPTQDNG